VEVTPEATATPEPVPTPGPATEPESGEQPATPEDNGQAADPEQVPTPEAPDPEQTDTEEPGVETPPADADEGSEGGEGAVTEEDLAATVAAMRAFDEEELDPSLAPEPAFTVFGCNVPINGEDAANAVSAGGDYLIAIAGLFGLIVARIRPGRSKKHRKERQEK
jgi:hypothetical protein